MSVIAFPRFGVWSDLFAGRRKVSGKRIRTAGKRDHCSTICCGTADCHLCLQNATALDVTFAWFFDGFSDIGNAFACTELHTVCTHSVLNSSFTLLKVSYLPGDVSG